MASDAPGPIFFDAPADLRDWLEANAASVPALWVGFRKKGTGRPSIIWPEAVDEALCVGWIDGVRKSIDADAYMIRFTPRKASSTWSAVNIGRVDVLTREGRMRPGGLAAFAIRKADRSGIYAYENRAGAVLDAESERRFRENPAAWSFFEGQPAGYRTTAVWWVVSAKRPETRLRRLDTLIADSAAGRRLKGLTRP